MVQASDIARLLGAELKGGDVAITCVRTLDRAEPGALVFATRPTPEIVARLNAAGPLFAIVGTADASDLAVPHVAVARPRLAFARAVEAFFAPKLAPASIAPTAIIGRNVRLGRDVTIGHYSVIGDDVVIGDRTIIRHHVVIADRVMIGADCVIKSHAVVGEDGFGIVYDENGRTTRVPHIGGLVIGDRVEIGALNSVCGGTIEATVLGDGVKADDHVHFSHNCTVDHDAILTAHSEVGAQVRVGHHAWFGPGTTTIERITVGPWAYLGIGATVIRNVDERAVVAGNPARYLRERDEE